MCGIAGLIHRGKSSGVGSEMTSMLTALKHRGPDSTGFAIYGEPNAGDYVMRFKVAEQEDMASGYDMGDKIAARVAEVEKRLGEHNAESKTLVTPMSLPISMAFATSKERTALVTLVWPQNPT